jgi:hypothetical protein
MSSLIALYIRDKSKSLNSEKYYCNHGIKKVEQKAYIKIGSSDEKNSIKIERGT